MAQRRFTARLVVLILFAAAAWRWSLTAASPCIARDGALYCWQARDLGDRGPTTIRDRAYDQHPLYSAAILGVQRALRAGGALDVPETWERSGRIASFLAGMAVVALCGVLALRVARAFGRGEDLGRVALLAMVLAGLLPLNTLLSADVMSDQLHAAFYLGAAVLLVDLRPLIAVVACGVLAGLAFLTRPEGAVVALGAAAALLASVRNSGARSVMLRIALLFAGCAGVAAPYIFLSGRLSPKLDKELKEQFQSTAAPARTGDETQLDPNLAQATSQHAALVRRDFDWYAIIPFALLELGHAGRVVVPLLATPALLALRRRWRAPPLLGLAVCTGTHFALCAVLLQRHGYLHARHLLPVVLLLIPFAAAALAGILALLTPSRRIAAAAVLVACIAPLAWYSLRVPNAGEDHVREHAKWLRSHDPAVREHKLVAGSSGRRIAFYAGMKWQAWDENQPDAQARYDDLFGHIVGGRADYLAIETGPGKELSGNDALLERMQIDPALSGRVAEMRAIRHVDGFTSHLWVFDWSG